MSIAAWFRSLAAGLFRRAEVAEDLEEELRSHIALRADDLERSGLDRAEAERRARIEFGGRERYKEEIHEAIGGRFLGIVLQDVRLAVRKLRKTPAFTIAAILTLALAIGANAVVFSVLNAFIIRPLNVANPQRLYGLWRVGADMSESYPDYLDLRDRNRTFDDLVAWNMVVTGLDAGGSPTRAFVEECSGNYFDALGVQPYLGRLFHPSDEHGPDSAPYLVLTYAYWRTHFQGDRGVVGRVVRLDKHTFTIVGVTPPRFNGTLLFFQPDGFMPIVDHAMFGPEKLTDRGNRWVFMTLGHLKPGVSKAQAIADLDSIGAGLARSFPKDDAKMTRFTLARPSMYGNYIGGPVRAFLTALMLLSGLILLA
ncbi:MAG: ABC transporter permease, partial [Terracidiphilus sp.]